MSIGMNLSTISYYGTEYPFLDWTKSSAAWYIHDSSGYRDISASMLDSNGYPTGALGGQNIGIHIQNDPLSNDHTNLYVMTYSGSATNFHVTYGNVVSQSPGQVVIQATDREMLIEFTDSGSDPIHDVHVVRQDQMSLFNAGEIFNPAFLAKMQPWSDLRFMDWNQTNSSNIVSWNQRTTLNSANWSNAPIEVEVALANKVHSDMWINIPTQADDNYIRQLATYVRDHLDSGLKLHLEYSNEVWNTSFGQTNYAQQKANQLWNGGNYLYAGNEIYYGYRSAQMMAITKDVFGAGFDNRVVGELAGFVDWQDGTKYALNGIGRANVGSATSLFKDVSITTYFGDEMSGQSASDLQTLLGWARGGAAGMDTAFQELNHGGLLQNNSSLDVMAAKWANWGLFAASQGLKLDAYEGGFSSSWFQLAAGQDRDDLLNFIGRLEADPRFGDLYTRMAQLFKAAGAVELNAYADAGSTSIWGPWGTLNSIYDNGSPRWNALLAAADKNTTTLTQIVVDTTHTSASTYTMADGATQITYTGTDAFTGTGNAAANTITGGNGGNHLYGLAGNDTLYGGTGADWLDGGTGADTMVGGAGDDIYFVDDAGDVVTENANEGTDEVRTTLPTYTLGANVENLTYTGTGAFTGTGNDLANVLRAGDGGSHLYGGAGNDTLYGGAGADWLDGGTGADIMIGGTGDDTYIVDNVGDVVTEQANGGTDTVRTSLATYTLGANVENLTYTGTGTGTFTGTGNELDNVIIGSATAPNKLYGGAGNDQLYGGSGNDYLDGGTGMDIMAGGAGNDVYIVRDSRDIVVELANNGLDEVRSYIGSYTLSANVENLTFMGTGDFTGTGNALSNIITGGSGNDHLYGGDGNDTLLGGAGNDWLDGGTGTDLMIGGTGDDTYIVDNVRDLVFESPNEGYDTIYASVSYTLPANVERLILTGSGNLNATGNGAANTLVGNSGNNVLDGGAGNDVLQGGGGIDTLTGGTGADTFVFKPGDLLAPSQAPGQTTDWITDFSRAEGDKIDLTALRVASGTPLSFGGASFHNQAGEIRVTADRGNWDVGLDLNGDGVADVHLTVTSKSGMLVASDFLI